MVCRTYEVIFGSRALYVVASTWQAAVEKAARHDSLHGQVNERANTVLLKVTVHYDIIVEDDWNQASIVEEQR